MKMRRQAAKAIQTAQECVMPTRKAMKVKNPDVYLEKPAVPEDLPRNTANPDRSQEDEK